MKHSKTPGALYYRHQVYQVLNLTPKLYLVVCFTSLDLEVSLILFTFYLIQKFPTARPKLIDFLIPKTLILAAEMLELSGRSSHSSGQETFRRSLNTLSNDKRLANTSFFCYFLNANSQHFERGAKLRDFPRFQRFFCRKSQILCQHNFM